MVGPATITQTANITGFDDTDATTKTKSGSIYAHKSGFVSGIELRGGATGVIGTATYKLELFEDSDMTRTNRIFIFDNIDNWAQETIVNDADGNPISLAENAFHDGYMNKESPMRYYVYYKLSWIAGTITTALTLDLKIVTTLR